MIDSILSARLQALKDDLTRVKDLELPDLDTSCWLALKSVQFEPGTAEFVYDRLAQAMRDQADKQLDAIWVIDARLREAENATQADQRTAILKAWYDYTETQKECQEFFGDCLAFMGGLNFRGMNVKGIEDRIYRVADAFVRECAARAVAGVSQWSPTMPFLPETLIRTAARVAGLRFQEWSIWMLPFSAHELGHVLFRDIEYLRSFVDRRTTGIDDLWEKARTEKQLHEFLADAFATYNLGPAYPSALLYLGLNPVSAEDKTGINSVPAKRAFTVLRFLELMGEEPGPDKIAASTRRQLATAWDGLVMSLDPHAARMSEQEQSDINVLVQEIWEYFGRKFTRPTAKYCYGLQSEYGWATARNWSETWKKQLSVNDLELQVPDNIGAQSKLADVLNAAWLCRLEYSEYAQTSSIAEAAYVLARAIMDRHSPASAQKPKV